jgi:hypothetical protein
VKKRRYWKYKKAGENSFFEPNIDTEYLSILGTCIGGLQHLVEPEQKAFTPFSYLTFCSSIL